jgi:dynein heavy chain
MPELERIFEQMVPENVHKEFRLWLTSAPSTAVPRIVLQRGVKMTNAAPKGLRSNLLRTYSQMDDTALEGCKYPQAFRRLLFGFCMFHAIVLERRRFGPIGWNIPYEFTDEDLTVCRRQLKLFLNQANQHNMPYKLVNYLGAHINYGGRVTDEHDKKLIGVILANLVCRETVTQGEKHKFSPSGVYYCPNVETRQDFMQHIKTLPVNAAPEIFGLHENARIVFQNQEATDLLQGIIKMAPRGRIAGESSSDDVLAEYVNQLQKEASHPFELEAVIDKYPTSYSESMNTVLVQEVVRYNRLLIKMKSSLTEVGRALKGLVVMSEQLEQICLSITNGKIPDVWASVGYLSLKPLTSFMEDLKERLGFLAKWIDISQPTVFWLGALFFPQGCISGILQNYARRHIIAIDLVVMNYDVPKTGQGQMGDPSGPQLIPPPDGAFVRGLFLEGCHWNPERLELQTSRPRELFSKLPVIWFIPGQNRTLPCSAAQVYPSPLYKVLSRQGTLSTTGHSTNFVACVDLPTIEHPDTWVRAGVALFLALSD